MDEKKKLYRARKDRVIAGVCAGLARYFNIDVWIVRLIFLALLFADGVAILIYIIMIIVVPEEPAEAAEVVSAPAPPTTSWWSNKRNLFAVILVSLGVVFFLKQLFPWPWFNAHLFWPLVIIAVGAWLIIKK
jgi:phage shock protein PspC (stress-responsive transcriptional regulator)